MADTPSSLPRRLKAESARADTLRKGAGSAASQATGAARVAVKKLFAAEDTIFFVILGTALFLVVFGLVMVLSSSSVEQYVATHDFFGAFVRQSMFAAIGIPLMLCATRVPPRFWQRHAWKILGLAMLLQLLVFTPLGIAVNGNRNWIRIGSFSAQPSEFLKLALILWIGMILVRKQNKLGDWKQLALPLIPVVLLAIALVMKGGDLGTTLIILMLVAVAVFMSGVKLRFFLVPLIALACLLPLVTAGASSRTDRIAAWLSGCTSEEAYQSTCWQTTHGLWALASGGVFGVGLGNSKAKWSWLPEADNDFIFAIIGEELGLIGAIVVLALFIVLAVSFIKILRSSDDPFVRIVTGGVMTWVIGQALVNIAVVLGLLPVLGVPLPLISAGGSSLIFTLFAIGVVLSFVHHRPDDQRTSSRARQVVPEADESGRSDRVGSLR